MLVNVPPPFFPPIPPLLPRAAAAAAATIVMRRAELLDWCKSGGDEEKVEENVEEADWKPDESRKEPGEEKGVWHSLIGP